MENENKTKGKGKSLKKDSAVTETFAEKIEERRKFTAKDVDLSQIITVLNGFHGVLTYKSKRTGEEFRWEEFGDEQDMELGELRNARNSNKKFFQNNWFMFYPDDMWVIDFLGLSREYKYSLPIDGFDDLFEKSAEEVAEVLSHLTSGQKRSVAYRAKQLIAEGAIDSNRVISALESGLGTALVER